MAAAAQLNIWDAQHNANGGAYFSGYSADFAFRQTVAEDFLSKEQTVAACARHWKKSDGFVRKAVDDFLTSHTLAPRARGGFRGEAAFAFEDLAYLDVCVQQRPRDHVWQHRLRLLQDLEIDIPESTVKHAICSVLGYNHRVLSSKPSNVAIGNCWPDGDATPCSFTASAAGCATTSEPSTFAADN